MDEEAGSGAKAGRADGVHGPTKKTQAAAWAVYDLANTIFSFNILSLYFPVWANQVLDVPDSAISIAFSTSMVLVAIGSPILGRASDHAGRRLPFLIALTLLTVTLTTLIGTGDVPFLHPAVPLALVIYAAANLFYQGGLVVYDAMLPDVSTPETVGIVGGAAVGIGYLGSVLGIITGATLLHLLDDPHPWIFAATGALFLLFALPCFLLVREPRAWQGLSGFSPGYALKGLYATAKDLVKLPSLGRFLIARFLYTDAVNTMILFMGIYATAEIGFSEVLTQVLLLVGILAAVGGGFGFGHLVDHHGPKRILVIVLLLWIFTLGLAAAIPLLDLPRWLFWGVAALIGIALGGTWAADRPLMLHLVPPARVGEFYGVYGMVGRFAAVSGPLVWGLIVDGTPLGRPAAVLAMLGFVLIGLLVLWTVRPHDRPVDLAKARPPPQT